MNLSKIRNNTIVSRRRSTVFRDQDAILVYQGDWQGDWWVVALIRKLDAVPTDWTQARYYRDLARAVLEFEKR